MPDPGQCVGRRTRLKKEVLVARDICRWLRGGFGVVPVVLFVLILTALLLPRTVFAGSTPDLGLIEPSELNRNRQAWAVLDARPKAEWQKGHIPGAHSFSWEDYTRTDEKGTPFRLWPPNELGAALARMGIGENTPVVVYGDADKSWGGEGWACWVLSWLGHQGPVRLLTGGIRCWRETGCPISTEPARLVEAPGEYQLRLRPELNIQAAELERSPTGAVLIDTRSTLEWLKGHLPDAVHIPWTDFCTGKDNRPLDPDALGKLLAKHGVDANKPVVYYCAGGVRSGYAWAVHQVCRMPSAKNYAGGMEDWKRRSSK